MKLRIARDATVKNLREQIETNLPRYRNGDFSFLSLDQTQFHELSTDADESALAKLRVPVAENLFEVENCLATHEYCGGLSPYDARDERLWCYLTHTVFLEYIRARWPIPMDDEKAVPHIETHLFARTNRQIERDNAASRLWWMAHLCTRVSGVDQKDALQAFLLRSDVRANIIERPTIAQSTNVFSVILRQLMKSAAGQQKLFERSTFRAVMVELNSVGGFRLLDILPEAEIAKIFEQVTTKKLGLSVY